MTEKNSVFQTLSELGVASIEQREVFSASTRDRADLTVFRDRISGVIYIEDFYSGDETYEEGAYRESNLRAFGSRDYEVLTDVNRRASAYQQYVVGRDMLEFGCGDGAFLHKIRDNVQSCCGVELQRNYIKALNDAGIVCHSSLDEIPGEQVDTVLSFHVIEHLPDPVIILGELLRVLKPGGTILIEVPHANDILLSKLQNTAFKKFTLWSQHLVLHTRESLKRLLIASGFEDIAIEGVQRYPLSNHLSWLAKGVPGGHKSPLAALDTVDLREAYQAALNKIDATDTLVAIARKPV
ncbi:MAG: class I SAM-dependent methyltransferase [Roseibium sp.]|uniref:class I SAM-dependent methyltransferase n=1 Tax=Parasphingorhabdus sp. TaxID=2709688 RepID=UPI0032968672